MNQEKVDEIISRGDIDEIKNAGKDVAVTIKQLTEQTKNEGVDNKAKIDELKKYKAVLGRKVGDMMKAKRKQKEAENKNKNNNNNNNNKKKKKNKKNEKKVYEGEGIDIKREDNFGEWYSQVVVRSEMIDYYNINGCYIFRPWSYEIWERIQRFLDDNFKNSGVKNCYFPLLVTEKALETEETNFEDFSPEVAWVTHYGDKKLNEKLAIRPTSETVMYPSYANWIRSYRDLPLRLNQWCNVVRWEFKDALPFIRSREFLWQEGHSAWETQEEADEEVLEILGYYADAYKELLCIPTIKGRKTDKEKFAGADYTTTIEAYVPGTGRGVQAATSHCLGQAFSRPEMFGITFEDRNKEMKHPIQNSWGFTTRSIGVMILVHGDNKGLVLPPRIAPIQVVIVPLHFKDKKCDEVDVKAKEIHDLLSKNGIRSHVDDRDGYTPYRKYLHWEVRGVPIRIEIGPKDIEKNSYTVCRRDVEYNKNKPIVSSDDLLEHIKTQFTSMHTVLFNSAKAKYDENIASITSYDEMIPLLNQKRVVLAPFCGSVDCEGNISTKSKEESEAYLQEVIEQFGENSPQANRVLAGKAKSLCIPFEEDGSIRTLENVKCFACDCMAKHNTLFGRSY
eukprot:TRINITY_DN2635_c0_g1_i2.p1 TRINITY_DN2635_c0_g1~~TRINITY_DN2635_c0_g1_i2.p1  ORF type:complete len:619 (+),score=249.66 TRINITY_DN2635_c0_g1_i2:94-1950(+)